GARVQEAKVTLDNTGGERERQIQLDAIIPWTPRFVTRWTAERRLTGHTLTGLPIATTSSISVSGVSGIEETSSRIGRPRKSASSAIDFASARGVSLSRYDHTRKPSALAIAWKVPQR